MKTASIPSLRVAPALRKAAENVLHKDETLSGFLEESLRAHINRRQVQQAFIARGLAARDEAQRTGQYSSAEEVLTALKDRLSAKKAKGRK